MIKSEFYETQVTWDSSTDPSITTSVTAPLTTLSNSINGVDPYLMGYVFSDALPSRTFFSQINQVQDIEQEFIEFKKVGDTANIAWGLSAGFVGDSIPRNISNTYTVQLIAPNTESGFNEWTAFSAIMNSDTIRFFNSLDIGSVTTNNYNLGFLCCVKEHPDNISDPSRIVRRSQVTHTFNGNEGDVKIYDFLIGNQKITINPQCVVASGGIDGRANIEVSGNDFNDGVLTLEITLNSAYGEYKLVLDLCIWDYRYVCTRQLSPGNVVSNYPNAKIFYKIHDTNTGIDYISSPGTYYNWASRYNSNAGLLISNNLEIDSRYGYFLNSGNIKYISGGFIGKIPGGFIRNAPIYTTMRTGNLLLQKISSGANVSIVFTSKEILNELYNIGTRVAQVNSYQYGLSNDVYYPLYNNDNSPKAEFATGEDIESLLQPWQLGDITKNEWTIEDMPIYQPGDLEGGDSAGDDIIPSNIAGINAYTNNFITLYALSPNSISVMGKSLWAKLGSDEFWETVGTVFKNDASINPADMLKYFNSLMFFPFNLDVVPNTPSTGIYMGRASEPLSVFPFPIRLMQSTWVLNGGSVYVPRYYNDFRDYEPCTQVQITVPFCGTVSLPPSEVMGKYLYINYNIDLLTGACSAYIQVASDTFYTIATLAGSCGVSVPLTVNNNIEYLQRIATIATGTIDGISSGAKIGAEIGSAEGAAAGAVIGAIGGGIGALAGLPSISVHKHGNASGFANYGLTSNAYVTIVRQKYEIPDNYGHTIGYACAFEDSIKNLRGLVICANVDTSGIPCNESEREEIKRLLEGGIYV